MIYLLRYYFLHSIILVLTWRICFEPSRILPFTFISLKLVLDLIVTSPLLSYGMALDLSSVPGNSSTRSHHQSLHRQQPQVTVWSDSVLCPTADTAKTDRQKASDKDDDNKSTPPAVSTSPESRAPLDAISTPQLVPLSSTHTSSGSSAKVPSKLNLGTLARNKFNIHSFSELGLL